MIELAGHGAVAALRREGADMGFDQHGFLPWTPAPVRCAPPVARVIDHFARARHIVGLKGGSRIRDVDLVVDAEFVARAGRHARQVDAEPAVLAAPQGMGFFQQQIDAFGRRRPKAKRRAVRRQPCAELPLIHAEPAKARTERGAAFASFPDAKSLTSCLTSAVFNSCCQALYSGSFGSLNVICSGAAFSTMKIGSPPGSVGPTTEGRKRR